MSYPCPSCRTPASLETGCPGCGRGPDLDAAEVVRLNHEIATLTVAVEQARQAHADLAAQLSAAHRQREEAAARVRLAAFVAAAPVVAVPPSAARPETSPRTAQNVLFTLGALLFGAAAIIFTGVAWTYGATGRAVSLAVVTALVLAVPPLTVRRGLRSTAETFAALGMLMIVLDGYAAWYSDLLGVGSLEGAPYAALVCVVTAAAGVGYGRLTGLHAPRLAALAAVQPLLPLLAEWLDAPVGGWALAFGGTAAINLLLVRADGLATRVLGWVGYGCAQIASGVCALVVLFVGGDTPALLTGLPVLLVSVLLVAAGIVGRARWLAVGGAVTVPPAVAIAILRPVAELNASYLLVVAAATVLVIALAAVRLPVARPGALVTVGTFMLITAAVALTVAVATMAASMPPFTAEGTLDRTWLPDWQLPAALALGTAALALLVPADWRRAVVTGGGVLVVLALPTWLALPWWAISALGLGVAAVLLLTFRPAWELSVAAALLTGHAVVVGLARPWSTAAVFGALALLGLAAAVRTRRAAVWWCGAGLAAVPAAVAATVYAAGAGGAWSARAGLAALAVPLAATLLFARQPRLVHFAPAAAGALSVGAVVVGIWPPLSELTEPAGVYPAVALLALAVATIGLRGTPRFLVGLAAVPLVLLASVLAALAVIVPLFAPYAWWEEAWTGAPEGVGLPGGTIDVTAGPAATLLILAAVCLATLVRAPAPTALPAETTPERAEPGPELAEPGPELAEPGSELAAPGREPAESGSEPAASAVGAPAPESVRPAEPGAERTEPGVLVGGGAWVWRPSGVAGGLVAVLAAFLAACGVIAVLVVAGAPWPVVPAITLAAGLAFGIAAAVRPAAAAAAMPALLLVGSGLSGLLPTPAATLVGLGAVIAAGAFAGAAGGQPAARVTGWLAAIAAGAGFAVAAVRAAELPLRHASFPVLAVGAVALGLGYLLRRRRPGVEGPAVDAVGHVAVLPALLLAWGDVPMAAGVATAWGAVLAVRAVLPEERARLPLAFAAGGSELLAWWFLLVTWEVALREAYTLPAAALALGAGYLGLRHNPRLGSWLALGPGLAAALLPSLAAVLVAGGQLERRLLLGVGAVAIVLIGAHRQWRAPVVAGGLTLVALTLHELAVWDLVPRWAYLAGGGLILIAVAMTYERRLRDLRKVRGALGRMT
ncbi:hypothetical protein SAMN05421684_3424 [Asanoa ishikariensis]|uniref:Uncharacterized protein n=1 Tax=Asanoa ishikariensis TaxID=137265 RepID=A0A1H3R2Q3_9ACTN|nr:hypothetical protein [Asanoa ishikariensis]SDZ20094.1 hypothetical protein SAMN05421684_3424 [Asanoa ishikariensis]